MKLALIDAPNISKTLDSLPLRTWAKDEKGGIWYRIGENFAVRLSSLHPHYESKLDLFNLERTVGAFPKEESVAEIPTGSKIVVTV